MGGCKYKIDNCTACASCNVACPVAAATREFPGPKLAGPAAERFRLGGSPVDQTLGFCTNCKNCDISCPAGVPISTLNMLARAEYHKKSSRSLRDWLLAHGELLAKMATPVQALANFGMTNPLTRRLLKTLGVQRTPPAYAPATFYRLYRKLKQQPFDAKVVFYPGCYIQYNQPQIGLDFIAVMQANRYEVIVPDDTVCCGSPLVTGAYMEEAAANTRRNSAALAEWAGRGYPIVTCCTSCSLMLKQEGEELFGADAAKTVAACVYDAAELLLDMADRGDLNTDFTPPPGRFIYHAPCHLRAQGIGRPAFELLKTVLGIDVADADAGCCGIAGNYGFKAERYEISMAIGTPLFKEIQESGALAAISDCGTCRLQIAHATGIKTLHPLTVLRKGYEPAYHW